MVKAYSLTSDSLGYFIGYTLIHASRVAIVSPWLSDVTVRLPLNDKCEDRHVRLSELLKDLPDTEVTFAVRSGEEHNSYIHERLPAEVQLTELPDLHAKAVVSPEYVYLGSANITQGGLEVNRELCEVIENEYGAVDAYLREELDISIYESD